MVVSLSHVTKFAGHTSAERALPEQAVRERTLKGAGTSDSLASKMRRCSSRSSTSCYGFCFALHPKSEYELVGIPYEAPATRIERLFESVRVIRPSSQGILPRSPAATSESPGCPDFPDLRSGHTRPSS